MTLYDANSTVAADSWEPQASIKFNNALVVPCSTTTNRDPPKWQKIPLLTQFAELN
jgi:hypothetical protein